MSWSYYRWVSGPRVSPGWAAIAAFAASLALWGALGALVYTIFL